MGIIPETTNILEYFSDRFIDIELFYRTEMLRIVIQDLVEAILFFVNVSLIL